MRDDRQREECLDDFLRRRADEGFVVESRTPTQAILVPRRRLLRIPGFIKPRRSDGRQVVTVDEHNVISVDAAQPRRW